MNKKWQTKKIGDFLTLEYGKPLDKALRKQGGKYPAYGANGIKDWSDKFYYDKKTIIIGRKGSAGEITLTEDKFWPLDVTYFVKFDEQKYDLCFIYYMLSCLNLPSLATGVKPGINRNHVYQIEVNIPNIQEQKRIVAILDQAFAGIEKIRANTEKNLKNARELFESYLRQVFSQRGEGWNASRFEELCDLITCGVAATPKYVNEREGVPFLSAQNVRDGEVVLDKYRFISKNLHGELTKKNKPSKGDVLYSRVGAKFGEAGVVENDFEFSVYVSLTLIKPKSHKLDSYYLKHYLNSPSMKLIAKKSISSSGVPNLNVKDVRDFPIYFPSLIAQKKIVSQIEEFSEEIQKLEQIYRNKSEAFENLKKSLLHQAFTGQLTKQEAVV